MATDMVTAMGTARTGRGNQRGQTRRRFWGRLRRTILIGCLLVTWSAATLAARWTTSPGLSGRLFVTDNLFLTPDEREGDIAVQVVPSISARTTTRRLQVRFAYGPSLVGYANNPDLNDVGHFLQANVSTEIIEEIFFLDISANANQDLIEPGRRAGFDALSNPEATTQTASFRVTPRIRLPILNSEFVRVEIRPGIDYSFVAETAEGEDNSGIGGQDTQIDIESGRRFTRMPWSINYRRQVFDTDTDEGFGRLDGSLGYRFDPRLRADLTLGYDEGRFESDDDSSGLRWRVTGTWTPTSRTSLAIGVGQAFFGNDGRLQFRHRQQHSVWTAEYDVSIENARQEIVDRQVVPFEDAFGNPIRDPLTGEIIGLDVGSAALTDDVFVRDGLRLGWDWSRRRSTVDLALDYDRRDYQDQDLDTHDARISLDLARRLSGRLTGRLRFDFWYHDEKNPEGELDFEQYRVVVGMNYRLGTRTNAGLDLLRTARNADDPLDEYTENRLDLTLSYAWRPNL